MYEDEKKLKIDNNLNRTEKLMKEQSNATNKQMKIMNAKRIKQSQLSVVSYTIWCGKFGCVWLNKGNDTKIRG